MGNWSDFATFDPDCVCADVDHLIDNLMNVCKSVDTLGLGHNVKDKIYDTIAEILKKEGYREGYVERSDGSRYTFYGMPTHRYAEGSSCYLVFEDPFLSEYYKLYKATVKSLDSFEKRICSGSDLLVFKEWSVNVDYIVDGVKFNETVRVKPGNIFRSSDYAIQYYRKKGIKLNKCN